MTERSDEACGFVVQTEIVPRSRGSAVSRGVDEDRVIVDTKTQRKPRERGKRTQHADVLHSGDDNCRSRVGQVSQCRRERRIRGLKTVRDGMGAQTSDEVCGTPDERAGVQITRRHSNKAGSIRENHTQTTRTSPQRPLENMRVKEQPHPEQRQNHKLESNARGDSRDHENTTVHRQSTNANAVGANPKSKGKGKESKGKGKGKDIKGKDKAKDVRNESSKKVKSDDRRKCFYCNKTGHVKAECNKRLRDLAEAEGKPVAASPHPHDATAIVPLQCLLPGERHTSTFVKAMPCVNNETSCEFSSEQTVRSPGAGSFALAETQRVRPHCCDAVKSKHI